MTAAVDHFLLTRFNLPSKGRHEVVLRAREDWLRTRVELFERYCLPSVRAQAGPPFCWLIYCAPDSPDWFLAWLREHSGAFQPIFREEVGRAELVADLHAVLERDGRRPSPRLITTNLDNDDSLAVDFARRLQQAAPVGDRCAVYLADGLIRCGNALYRRVDPHNAFCSVHESWDDPATCWSDWHNLLPRQMPAVVLRGEPAWVQVIHGGNVSNRVRGRRTRPRAYQALFPGLFDALPDPGPGLLARDRLLAGPARGLREGGRAAAKKVLTTLGGKRGLDGVKGLLAARRARGMHGTG